MRPETTGRRNSIVLNLSSLAVRVSSLGLLVASVYRDVVSVHRDVESVSSSYIYSGREGQRHGTTGGGVLRMEPRETGRKAIFGRGWGMGLRSLLSCIWDIFRMQLSIICVTVSRYISVTPETPTDGGCNGVTGVTGAEPPLVSSLCTRIHIPTRVRGEEEVVTAVTLLQTASVGGCGRNGL